MIKHLSLTLVVLSFVLGEVVTGIAIAQSVSQRLIQAALKAEEINNRYEGDVNYWNTQPAGNELLKLEKAFNDRFKLKIKLKQTPLTSAEVGNRFVVSAQAGRPAEGDVTVVSPPTLSILRQRNLLEDFDWNGILGKDLPELQKRVAIVPPEYRNKALEIYHLVYIVAYRTDRLKKEELPKTWEDLTNPKWAGRFAVANVGYPFNYFLSLPGWNEQKVLNLVRAIRDNRAVFVKGSPGAAAALQSGEVSLAINSVGNIEELKAKGIPVDWVALPGTILAQKTLIVPKGAAHPNLAHLFGAWLTTEGRGLYEGITKDGLAWPDENSLLASRLKQLGLTNNDFVLIDTAEKDALAAKMIKPIGDIYLGR
jgi:ABC-type Fe3+ transport system substrate-binding protein